MWIYNNSWTSHYLIAIAAPVAATAVPATAVFIKIPVAPNDYNVANAVPAPTHPIPD